MLKRAKNCSRKEYRLITVQDNTMLKHRGDWGLLSQSLITVQDNTMLKPRHYEIPPFGMFNYRSG